MATILSPSLTLITRTPLVARELWRMSASLVLIICPLAERTIVSFSSPMILQATKLPVLELILAVFTPDRPGIELYTL